MVAVRPAPLRVLGKRGRREGRGDFIGSRWDSGGDSAEGAHTSSAACVAGTRFVDVCGAGGWKQGTCLGMSAWCSQQMLETTHLAELDESKHRRSGELWGVLGFYLARARVETNCMSASQAAAL